MAEGGTPEGTTCQPVNLQSPLGGAGDGARHHLDQNGGDGADWPLGSTTAESEKAAATSPMTETSKCDKTAPPPVPPGRPHSLRRGLTFVVNRGTEPRKAAADGGASYTQSPEPGTEESFSTAYGSPLAPTIRLAAGEQAHPSSLTEGASAPSEAVPVAAAAAEATFPLPAPPTRPGARPRLKAPGAAKSTVEATADKPGCLAPPPAASRRPERPSAPVKARIPMGRPMMAPPSGVPKVAPRQQAQKQEPPPVQPKFCGPRGPGRAAAAVAASPMTRQGMPACPIGASGAARRTAAGGRTPVPAVATRPPVRPPAPSKGAASASKERAAPAKPPLANGHPNPEPHREPAPTKAQPPHLQVGDGFSGLPTMPGSSAAIGAAPLASSVAGTASARLSSTPARGDVPPLDSTICPELTPIRRQ